MRALLALLILTILTGCKKESSLVPVNTLAKQGMTHQETTKQNLVYFKNSGGSHLTYYVNSNACTYVACYFTASPSKDEVSKVLDSIDSGWDLDGTLLVSKKGFVLKAKPDLINPKLIQFWLNKASVGKVPSDILNFQKPKPKKTFNKYKTS